MNSDSDMMDIDGWQTTATAQEGEPHASEREISMTALAEVDDGDGFAEDFEVLPLRFLETPTEAEEERNEQAFHLAAQRHTSVIGAPSSSRRSSRRSRKEPKQLSVRQIKVQRRAKFIIYGGIGFVTLLVLILASYRLPIILYGFGKISKPYIWPWGYLPENKKWEKDSAIPPEQILTTKDGRKFNKKAMDSLANDARVVLPECQRLFEEAVEVYDGGEGDKVKSLVLMTQAQQMLEPIANRLDPVKDLAILERINKKADRLIGEIGMKNSTWRHGLSIQDIDRLNAALKKAGLVKDAPDDELGLE